MKKQLLTALGAGMFFVAATGLAVAKTTTITSTHELPYMVEATTVVSDIEPRNVMVTFSNPNGTLGTVTLTPTHPELKNLVYELGKQKIKIKTIEYNPTGDPRSGAVAINCKVSDTSGWNRVRYNGLLATWSRQ